MTKRLDERRDEILREKFKGKRPCLIPKPEAVTENSMLTTCHENAYLVLQDIPQKVSNYYRVGLGL